VPDTFFDILKQKVDENNYSDALIMNVTKEQVAALLYMEPSAISEGALLNVKKKLIKDRAERRMQEVLQGLKDQLMGGSRVWLKSNYPDSVIVKDTKRRSVTIHFDGLPEEED